MNTQASLTNTQVEASSTRSYQTMREWQRDRSGSVSGSGNYGVKNFEGSVAVSTSVKNSFENKKVRSEREYSQARYKVKLAESGLTFARQFLHFLDDNLRFTCGGDQDARECWKEVVAPNFVEEFGTHVIHEVTMGGRVTAVVESESSADATLRERDVNAKMCAGIDMKVKSVSGCTEAGQTDSSSQSSQSAFDGWDVLVQGGDRGVCTKTACDMDAFAESVDLPARLEVIDAKLQPITYYIKKLAASNDFLQFRGTGSTSEFSAPHLEGLELGIAAYLEGKIQPDLGADDVSFGRFHSKFSYLLVFVTIASVCCGTSWTV